MPDNSNIELELRQNYVDSDVTESIIRYVNAHGFDADSVDELLLELGYDEIFNDTDHIDYSQRYLNQFQQRNLLQN